MNEAYRAASEGAAFYDATHHGRVTFRGADHLDFLHRMSTNDTLQRSIGDGFETVFCDARGRIVQLACLNRISDDEIVAFLDAAPAADLLAWLDRYHFSERIEWADLAAETAQLELVGPRAAETARRTGADLLAVAPLGRVPTAEPLRAMRIEAGGNPGARFWGPPASLAQIRDQLLADGVQALGEEAWQTLRVEWGRPGPDSELNLEHNPWEAGLEDAIHMDKGCYIGQEVVARLDTYQKTKQRLVGLHLAAAAAPGAEVDIDGRVVGTVTSVAESPRQQGWLALAYVRTAHCGPGTPVTVEGVVADVAALPFDLPRP